MRKRIHERSMAFWLWLPLVACACTGGQTGDEGPRPRKGAAKQIDAGKMDADFIDSLRRNFGNYDPAHSVSELADRSERIAVGTIGAVREGRRFRASDPNVATAMVELKVSEVLKGEPATRLYVELYFQAFDAANVPDPLPKDRILLFLRPAVDRLLNAEDSPTIADIPELPDDETLYTPATPQGLMIETESGSVDSFELPVSSTFQELLDSIRE
jgi:hypothetical protein